MSARPPAVEVVIEAGAWDADAETTVQRALTEAAIALGTDFSDRSVAVLLTDDAALRSLNAQWRGIDKATNVLSFPAAAAPPVVGLKPLGDIAIAGETTAREAREEGKLFAHHLAHLALHGFLHLIGYDHEQDAQAETMEQVERDILARIGIADPYMTRVGA
jgi:probable rRNA maturation factor